MRRRISTAFSLVCLFGVIVAWGQGSRGWGMSFSNMQGGTTFFIVDGWAHMLLWPHYISTKRGFQTLSKPQVRVAKRVVDWTGAKQVRCPLFVLCFLFVLSPAMHLYVAIKRRGEPGPGHCAHCGYNLTGNLSGTCPECGEPASATAAGSLD